MPLRGLRALSLGLRNNELIVIGVIIAIFPKARRPLHEHNIECVAQEFGPIHLGHRVSPLSSEASSIRPFQSTFDTFFGLSLRLWENFETDPQPPIPEVDSEAD